MSAEAKKLLLRLKKEKKVVKQIDIIQKLRDYNQEEIVTNVLLVHLQRKEHDSLRLEILSALNYDNETIIKPLVQILNDSRESITIKEKVITLLGQSKGKKALNALMSAFKKVKDSKILDNVTYALTFFEDKKVEKPLIKALQDEELRLQALTGLARNEVLLLGSSNLIKAIVGLTITKNFEKLHFNQILDTICNEFNYDTIDDILVAIQDKSINPKIAEYSKRQSEINKTLRKVS